MGIFIDISIFKKEEIKSQPTLQLKARKKEEKNYIEASRRVIKIGADIH